MLLHDQNAIDDRDLRLYRPTLFSSLVVVDAFTLGVSEYGQLTEHQALALDSPVLVGRYTFWVLAIGSRSFFTKWPMPASYQSPRAITQLPFWITWRAGQEL